MVAHDDLRGRPSCVHRRAVLCRRVCPAAFSLWILDAYLRAVGCRLKALLFALVRDLEFALAVPAEDIIPVGTLIQRPNVRSEMQKGAQMPLVIRPYVAE